MVHKQHSESVEFVVARFVARLTKALAREIDARSRVLAAEYLAAALAGPGLSAKSTVLTTERRTVHGGRLKGASPEAASHNSSQDAPDRSDLQAREPTDSELAPRALGARSGSGAPKTRATARKPRLPTPVDPEQESRDADFERLRTLLKPTRYENPSADPSIPYSSASVVLLDAPHTDPLRLLEDEIRDRVHALAQVGTARCTARIAAWTGRVRAYEEQSGNRMAAQLMLEKLRALAYAMEAGRIEALTASWRTADWPSYIRKNEQLADAPPTPEPRERPDESTRKGPADGSDYSGAWS
ncbi:MAG: hypothetical protein ABJA82_03430 [Myxococcales bacterium]